MWYDRPDAAARMGQYCAAAVLAALLDCTRTEAGRTILAEGLQSKALGTVNSTRWHAWLRTRFGGVTMYAPERPDGLARYNKALKRYWARVDDWEAGMRIAEPRAPSRKASFRYTVAAFLRKHSKGTIVISIGAHTLLARDGKVVADTQSSRSQRGLVKRATFLETV